MNNNQKGYVLMTVCGRFLGKKSGTYHFVTDPFEAKFFLTIKSAKDGIVKSYEMWGENLWMIPTERTINLLG